MAQDEQLLDIECYLITDTGEGGAVLLTDGDKDSADEYTLKVWVPNSMCEVEHLGYEPGFGSRVRVTAPASVIVDKGLEPLLVD